MENWMSLFYVRPVAPHVVVNALFLYSFLGWMMECVVIRLERGVWENRGFVHLPLCIIYGFGAILGYALLRPFSANLAVLYVAGAVMATAFEYLTARLMLHFFGALWWDYTNHRWNYKGILCLQSTLGWGVIAVLLFVGMHRAVFGVVARIPAEHRRGAGLRAGVRLRAGLWPEHAARRAARRRAAVGLRTRRGADCEMKKEHACRRLYGVAVPDDAAYLALVDELLASEAVRSMDAYNPARDDQLFAPQHQCVVSELLLLPRPRVGRRGRRARRAAARSVFVRLAHLPPQPRRAAARL